VRFQKRNLVVFRAPPLPATLCGRRRATPHTRAAVHTLGPCLPDEPDRAGWSLAWIFFLFCTACLFLKTLPMRTLAKICERKSLCTQCASLQGSNFFPEAVRPKLSFNFLISTICPQETQRKAQTLSNFCLINGFFFTKRILNSSSASPPHAPPLPVSPDLASL
jgi:hypothetical protein